MSGNAARLQAVQQIVSRETVPVSPPQPLQDIWAENVFNLATMQSILPKGIFKSIKKTITSGEKARPLRRRCRRYGHAGLGHG